MIRRYRLAPNFVNDHWARALPEDPAAVSDRVVETRNSILVELDERGYDELLSDANYYATQMVSAGFNDPYARALCRSAARVAAKLVIEGRPS